MSSLSIQDGVRARWVQEHGYDRRKIKHDERFCSRPDATWVRFRSHFDVFSIPANPGAHHAWQTQWSPLSRPTLHSIAHLCARKKMTTVNEVHKGKNKKQCCFFKQYTFNPISETHPCQFRLAPAYVACGYWHATGCGARPVQEMSNFQPKIQDLFPIHKYITTIQQAEGCVITAATVTSLTNDHHIKEQSSKRQWEKKKQGTVMRNELTRRSHASTFFS